MASAAPTFQVVLFCVLSDRNNTLLSAMKYDPATKTMEQMIAMERDDHGQVTAKIFADKAIWTDNQTDNETDFQPKWKLVRGTRFSRDSSQTDFSVSGNMARTPVQYYESDWQPDDLLLRQAVGWTWFLSINQLNSLLDKPHLIPNINEVIAAKHVRFTQPLINMLILLLGLPFFLNREPHNVLLSVGMCLLLAISCFMLSFICHNLAASVDFPALLAWLPIIIFGPIAAMLIENIKT